MLVETMNSLGNWDPACELSEITWCGRPLADLLCPEKTDALNAGRRVSFDTDWYAVVRLPRASRPTPAPAAPSFTCPACGGHRDTNVRGRCDDCD